MNIQKVLDNRLMSGFPVSIKTGLALETIFDPIMDVYDPDREVKKYKLKENSLYAINLYTLIRNLIMSVDYNLMKELLKRDISKPLINTVIQEIEVIDGLCKDYNINLSIHIPDFRKLKELNKNKPNKHYTGTMAFINAICESVDSKIINILKTKDIDVGLKHHTTIITTHMMVDMIDISNNTLLLESNTGNIIDRKHRGKKLNLPKDVDYTRIPLNFTTLYVYGDDSKYIIPFSTKIKREFTKLLLERGVDYTKSNEWCKSILVNVMRKNIRR